MIGIQAGKRTCVDAHTQHTHTHSHTRIHTHTHTHTHTSAGQVETVESFLTKIGRDCAKYKDKFGSWEELFTVNREEMKKRGLSVQARRYILTWADKYRCVRKGSCSGAYIRSDLGCVWVSVLVDWCG